MNNLCHGHKIDVVVICEDFIDPVEESIQEFWIVLEPCSVIVETEWCTICVIMTFKVVVKKSIKLITC